MPNVYHTSGYSNEMSPKKCIRLSHKHKSVFVLQKKKQMCEKSQFKKKKYKKNEELRKNYKNKKNKKKWKT